jgi:hypothetical protein
MMNADVSKPLTVCTYGFNVPCRRFLITANVTRDKRLPIVDEFVLRTLKLCERVPVKRLGTYFGFSEAETETVMSDLVARGFLVVEGDTAVLYASAHQHFRGANDGSPRIMEIETWIERLWFDLVSRNMMAPERVRPTRNLIEIKPSDMARDLPTAFARKAFEENFAEYLRKVRRINSPDRFGLYSISDVAAGRFGFVVLRGSEDVVLDPQPKLSPRLLEVDLDSVVRFRPLTNALTDAYRQLSRPEPSAAALHDFMKLTGDQAIAGCRKRAGTLDIAGWLADAKTHADPTRRAVVGASYIGRNSELFGQLVAERGLARLASASPRQLELLWLRPAGSSWGTSPDLQESVANIRAIVRSSLSKEWGLKSLLIVPQVARRENNRRFDRIFDEAYDAPAGQLSPSVEVVLLRDVCALVLVWVAVAPNVAIPIGFAISEPKAVDQVERSMGLSFLNGARPIWARAQNDEADDALSSAPPVIG